ncbi:hypothetical protein FOA52_011432 [Chlamydomonas sp. UWO 241]|nr:hypothetical protein FOA52_011432 [Chlamydomonas sp. UWO 241]
MPSCVSVSDLSPLGACSDTLEELWMAGNEQEDASEYLLEMMVEGDLQVPIAIAAAGVIPRLVQLLAPHTMPRVKAAAAFALRNLAGVHPETDTIIANAGAIPA